MDAEQAERIASALERIAAHLGPLSGQLEEIRIELAYLTENSNGERYGLPSIFRGIIRAAGKEED